MKLVERYGLNSAGRDYVVGDVHGCFDLLRSALLEAGFNEGADRLFSVGDLVDRGPKSEQVVEWLAKPWFHAVRGNHEQMAIGVANGKHDLGNYFRNGGGWFLALRDDDKIQIADALCQLPFCIEVETPEGLVGIVHAEVAGNDWRHFTSALENAPSNNKRRELIEIALWSRDRIRTGDQSEVSGVSRVFVGHTPMKEWAVLGNVYYIDTGACFGKKLTLFCINDETVYEVKA